jgi:hypothetical protein
MDIHAPAGFENAFPAYEWLQTHALDRATTGFDVTCFFVVKDLDCLHSVYIQGNITRKYDG